MKKNLNLVLVALIALSLNIFTVNASSYTYSDRDYNNTISTGDVVCVDSECLTVLTTNNDTTTFITNTYLNTSSNKQVSSRNWQTDLGNKIYFTREVERENNEYFNTLKSLGLDVKEVSTLNFDNYKQNSVKIDRKYTSALGSDYDYFVKYSVQVEECHGIIFRSCKTNTYTYYGQLRDNYLKANEVTAHIRPAVTLSTSEVNKIKNGLTLTVNYVDEEGNKIADSLVTTKNAYKSSYTTTSKEIEGYELKTTPSNANGTFENDVEVTYVYSKKSYTLTVKYVDESGNSLRDDVVTTKNFGDTYTTEQKTFEGYTFKEVNGTKEGIIGSSNTTITYVYTKNSYTLTVKYVDESGNDLTTALTSTKKYDESYTTEEKAFEGYTFKEVSGTKEGKMPSSNVTVKYIYTVNSYTLTIKYVNEEGTSLRENITITKNYNESYTTEEKSFDGYYFKEIDGNKEGKMPSKDMTITYIYSRNSYDLIVKYVDEAGFNLTESITESKDYEEEYTTEEKSFEGYKLKEVTDNKEGTMGLEPITVIYTYEKLSYKLTVKYVDQDGKSLTDDVVSTVKYADEYNTEEKTFEGYVLNNVTENKKGTITLEDITVIYTYEFVMGEGGEEETTNEENYPLVQTGSESNIVVMSSLINALSLLTLGLLYKKQNK